MTFGSKIMNTDILFFPGEKKYCPKSERYKREVFKWVTKSGWVRYEPSQPNIILIVLS